MAVYNIHEAKTHFSRLVKEAAAGREVVIIRAGKVVAKLVPAASGRRRVRFGALKGQLRVPDDFDAPLPEEVRRSFQ